MEIEEYLKQKRALEAKKQLLEAKTTLKETLKKEKPAEKRTAFSDDEPEEHERHHVSSEPSLKPWMLWDILIILIMVTLFITSYFFPRYDEKYIENLVNGKLGEMTLTETLKAVAQMEKTPVQQETGDETDAEDDTTKEENIKEPLPGPEFTVLLEDSTLGTFDKHGKVNNEILVIEGSNYYKEFSFILQSEESVRTKCFIDRTTTIDTDYDGTPDITEPDDNYVVIELNPGQREEIPDTIPGEVKSGTYTGTGLLVGEYVAECFFCLDEDCNQIEEDGEEKHTAQLKVNMNPLPI